MSKWMICYFWRTAPSRCRPGTKAVLLPTKPISGQSQPRLSHPKSSEESGIDNKTRPESMIGQWLMLQTDRRRKRDGRRNWYGRRPNDSVLIRFGQQLVSRHSHTLANLPYFVIQLHGFEIPNDDLVVVFCDSQVISKGWDALALGSGSLSFVQRGHCVFWINFQKPDAGNVESLVKDFTW